MHGYEDCVSLNKCHCNIFHNYVYKISCLIIYPVVIGLSIDWYSGIDSINYYDICCRDNDDVIIILITSILSFLIVINKAFVNYNVAVLFTFVL